MSHYRRAYLQGGCYFFTAVTHHRAPIFTNEARVEMLRTALRKVMATRPFQIDAMVVLPDHLHCVWRLPEGDADYSSRWREVKKATSWQMLHDSPIWQRRFWEHVIRDEADWRNHLDYVHYNPVKHGLVNRPTDWAWSSLEQAVQRGWYEATWGAQIPANIIGMEYE